MKIGVKRIASFVRSGETPPVPPVLGDRGVFIGGYNNVSSDVMDHVTISTTGVAQDFGDLVNARQKGASFANGAGERGVMNAGIGSVIYNSSEYITIGSAGNATVTNGLLNIYYKDHAAVSNGDGDRGVAGGGRNAGNEALFNTLTYATISTMADAADFGDLTTARWGLASCANVNGNRGVFGGGAVPARVTLMDFITINSTGNATTFGNLTLGRRGLSATDNGQSDRGVFMGGESIAGTSNVMDYITINSGSNAISFGNLTLNRNINYVTSSATSNKLNDRGICAGGQTAGGYSDVIDYITISTPGNAQDFGDLTVARGFLTAVTNA